MATISDEIIKIQSDLKKIPCLNGDDCKLHKEIMENLEVILKIVQANQIEFIDHRKALVIMLEEHGVPCDDIFGWDLNTYRESKENVREKGIQRSGNSNKDANVRKGIINERKIKKREKRKKRRTYNPKRKERKIRRNVKKKRRRDKNE